MEQQPEHTMGGDDSSHNEPQQHNTAEQRTNNSSSSLLVKVSQLDAALRSHIDHAWAQQVSVLTQLRDEHLAQLNANSDYALWKQQVCDLEHLISNTPATSSAEVREYTLLQKAAARKMQTYADGLREESDTVLKKCAQAFATP